MLPKDPAILQSVINTKLRDFYSSPEELCDREDEDLTELTRILEEAGLRYNPEHNRFE